MQRDPTGHRSQRRSTTLLIKPFGRTRSTNVPCQQTRLLLGVRTKPACQISLTVEAPKASTFRCLDSLRLNSARQPAEVQDVAARIDRLLPLLMSDIFSNENVITESCDLQCLM